VHDSYISAPYILTKLKASQGLLQGMSYWTYTDLFEEPGPPTAPFQGGFGLLNPPGHSQAGILRLQVPSRASGRKPRTSDPQAMLAKGRKRHGCHLGLRAAGPEGEQSILLHKVIPSHAAAPVQLRANASCANACLSLEVHRTGYHANDAYSAYIEMGSPKELTAAQITHLNELTRDLPETDKVVRSRITARSSLLVPMNSNDVVLVNAETQPDDQFKDQETDSVATFPIVG
jgi:xylan 1,4-beta-xylosidase